jgi:hypothetical protein
MSAEQIIIPVKRDNLYEVLTTVVDKAAESWRQAVQIVMMSHADCTAANEALLKAIGKPNIFDALEAVQEVVNEYGYFEV